MKSRNAVKKLVSLVLGIVMVMGLHVPVMAAEEKVVQHSEFITVTLENFLYETTETILNDDGTVWKVVTVYWLAPGSAIRVSNSIPWEGLAWSFGGTAPTHRLLGIDVFGAHPNATDDWVGINGGGWMHDKFELPYTAIYEDFSWVGEGYFWRADLDRAIFSPRMGQSTILYFGFSTQEQQPIAPPTTAPNLNTASTWAHEGINNAIAAGLVPQSLQNNYTNNITRAEFTALAVALYETVAGREITARMTFNDTSDVNVQKMGALGVVTGVGDGNFAPNDTLTREQAAVMLARLSSVMERPLPPTHDRQSTFADNEQIAAWARPGVGQVQAAGIMGGVGNNQFNPLGQFTIEQSIITMMRLFDIFN